MKKKLFCILLSLAMVVTMMPMMTMTAWASSTTTIVVHDYTGWDEMSLYLWGDVNDLGGGWPGIAPTSKEGNVYTFIVEHDGNLFENLIFNNNGNGLQLADYPVTLGTDLELTVTTSGAIPYVPVEWDLLSQAMKGEKPDITPTEMEISLEDGTKLFTVKDADGTRTIKLLSDIKAGTSTSALLVPNGKKVVLDLNGHVLNRGLVKADGTITQNDHGSVIEVLAGGELTIEDNDKTLEHEGYVDAKGLWHIGSGSGTPLTIKGGAITGGAGTNCTDLDNKYRGGGIRVQGELVLAGGSIIGNTAKNGGGGISVAANAKFTLVDGTIAYNTSYGYGGGVCVNSTDGLSGTFTMTGGQISENVAYKTNDAEYDLKGNGGGVFVDDVFNMVGGVICNNKSDGYGAGVYIADDDVEYGKKTSGFRAGGSAQINNNYAKGSVLQNLYLPAKKVMTFGDGSNFPKPQDGMAIGVTFGGQGKISTNGASEIARYIFSDNMNYYIDFNAGGYFEMKVPADGYYAINVMPSENGIITTEVKEAQKNDIVTLIVKPYAGFMLEDNNFDVVTNDGTFVPISISDDTYSFTMPESPVTVTANFVEVTDKPTNKIAKIVKGVAIAAAAVAVVGIIGQTIKNVQFATMQQQAALRAQMQQNFVQRQVAQIKTLLSGTTVVLSLVSFGTSLRNLFSLGANQFRFLR